MAGSSKTTTNHIEIKKWVEARAGHPATVKGTQSHGETGVLRINFPEYSGEDKLQQISWEEFFKKFDESKLAFLYQDETSYGKESRFCKLVSQS